MTVNHRTVTARMLPSAWRTISPRLVPEARQDLACRSRISRYDFLVEVYASARKHGVPNEDIEHAVDYSLVAAEDEDGKCLYLGPDRAGNLLEVVSVIRTDGTEIVIHAMGMRRKYEPLLREIGDVDD